MMKYFKDVYGGTASLRVGRDGTAVLRISDGHGRRILDKAYGSERGAKCAMGRYSDGWREVKGGKV